MRHVQLTIGLYYIANVSGKKTVVRLDDIREVARYIGGGRTQNAKLYDVTNLRTGRKTTFKSPTKFQRQAMPDEIKVWL